MNGLGTKKTGTSALIAELLLKVFTLAQKKKAAIAGAPVFLSAMRPPLPQ